MTEDMVKPDYEQICKEYEIKIEELNRQNNDMQMKIQGMKYHIQRLEKIQEMKYHIQRLEGRIEGLEFSIRCNGVSGGEVVE